MDGYPPQPAQPGAQYPQGYGQQAPQWQQQPYPQRAASPPGSGGRGWIVAVVLGIIGITLTGGLIAAYFGYSAYRQAQVRQHAAAAEAHVAELTARLATVRKKAVGTSVEKTDASTRALESANTDLDGIARDLTAASDDVRRIDDTAIAAAYTAGLKQAAAAVARGRVLVLAGQNLTALEQRTASGLKDANEGTTLVDQAIALGNKGDYAGQVAKCADADEKYSSAQAHFEDAARLDPRAGMQAATPWMAKAHQVCATLRTQGIHGTEGRMGAYNELVVPVNKLTAEMNAIRKPAAVSDPHFGQDRIQKLANDMAAATSAANTAFQEARSKLEQAR